MYYTGHHFLYLQNVFIHIHLAMLNCQHNYASLYQILCKQYVLLLITTIRPE